MTYSKKKDTWKYILSSMKLIQDTSNNVYTVVIKCLKERMRTGNVSQNVKQIR